ncbi:TPA: hypothetical protein I8Y10_000978 [Kluyvera cryocrescens]|nr:hypothetical protein [Kluyvera cryocrescens]
MSNYGKAALLAYRMIVNEQKEPIDAWIDAISALSDSPAVRSKVCPKVTFVALAESGFLLGVDSRESTRKAGILWERAQKAALYLLRHPDATYDELCEELGYWDKQGSYNLIMVLAGNGVLRQSE